MADMAKAVIDQHIQPDDEPAAVPPSNRVAERLVVFVGYNGIQALDLVGPMEVFTKANAHAPSNGPAPFKYELVVSSPKGGMLEANSGLRIASSVALSRVTGPVDTIVVAGGSVDSLAGTQEGRLLLQWLASKAPQARRVSSICTGAFLLGAAGLLDGRRATTHWSSCSRFQEMFPSAKVVADAIFVADGNIYTSAGVTAGIDLALAMVEQDLGAEVAMAVARDLVLYLRRPGGQSQFSANLAAQAQASDRFRELLSWIAEHPANDMSIPALAHRAAMSERTFVRLFKAQTGMTAATYVELVRLDRAKMLLETSDWPLARVAERSGLGSVASLIRACRRRLGITPEQYRQRFALPEENRAS